MQDLVKYLKTNLAWDAPRPVISTDGGVYIWDAEEKKILAGPFVSVDAAVEAKSLALTKALSR